MKKESDNGQDNCSGLKIRSGGTTGRQKMINHSWKFNHMTMQAGAEGLRHLKYRPFKIANLLTAGNLNGAFLFVHGLTEALNATAYPVGVDVDMIPLKQLLINEKIDTICCTPVFIEKLVNEQVLHDLKNLRNVLYIGQSITERLVSRISEMSSKISVRALSYSTTETGPIGYQCQYLPDSEYHIHENYVRVAIYDSKLNLDLGYGEAGKILVTPVHTNNPDLIRYETGDMGMFKKNRCRCGSSGAILCLFGRQNESVKVYLKDSKLRVDIYASDIFRAIKTEVENLHKNEIQACVQKSDHTVRIQISISGTQLDAGMIGRIRSRIMCIPGIHSMSKMGIHSCVEIQPTSEDNFLSTKYLKRPFFILREKLN